MAHWKYTVDLKDVWRNWEIPFRDQRDQIIARIRESAWARETGDPVMFGFLIRHLERAENAQQFDAIFSAVYNLADDERVWIETF